MEMRRLVFGDLFLPERIPRRSSRDCRGSNPGSQRGEHLPEEGPRRFWRSVPSRKAESDERAVVFVIARRALRSTSESPGGRMIRVLPRFAKLISLVLITTVFALAQQPPIVEKCNCPTPPQPGAAGTQTSTQLTPGPFGHPHPQIP